MPALTTERQALERERADFQRQLAVYQGDVDVTAHEHKARRERLAWQIRRIQKRIAEIDALLTGGEKLGHPH
jgi:hypothetical protein